MSWCKMRKIQGLEAYIFAAKIILSSKYKYLYIIYKYILYRQKKLKPGQHQEKKNKNNARIILKKQNRETKSWNTEKATEP